MSLIFLSLKSIYNKFFSGFRLVGLAVDIRQSQMIVDYKIFLVNEIKESVNFHQLFY